MATLKGFIALVLLVGAISTFWYLAIEDFERNYVESNVTDIAPLNSSYELDLDVAAEVNSSLSPVTEALFSLGEEDQGFIGALIDVGVAIPRALIALPTALFSILGTFISNAITIFTLLGIPQQILLIGATMLVVFILFKLLTAVRGGGDA